MKHLITKDVPASKIEIIDKITCDFCGLQIKERTYEVDKVEVKRKTGDDYPEGGSGEEYIIDICGKCFETKLIPWALSHGVKPRIEKWEW